MSNNPTHTTHLDALYHSGTNVKHVFTNGEVTYQYDSGVIEFRDNQDLVIVPIADLRAITVSEKVS